MSRNSSEVEQSRFQTQIPVSVLQTIDDLQLDMEMQNRTQVVIAAVRLLETVQRMKREGGTLVIQQDGSEREVVLVG